MHGTLSMDSEIHETTMIKILTQGDDYWGVTYDTFKNKQL
jgi:hypothetical protein